MILQKNTLRKARGYLLPNLDYPAHSFLVGRDDPPCIALPK